MEAAEFLDRFSGTMLTHAREHGFIRCDTCLEKITAPETIGVYASNYDINTGERPLRLNVAYCSDCLPDALRIETKGATEFLFKTDLIDEGGIPAFTNPIVLTTSKKASGLEWDPAEVWERFTGVPIEALSQGMDEKNSAITPAHVEGVLYSVAGVDLREYLTSEGVVDISESELEEVQSRVRNAFLSLDISQGDL